MTQYGKLCSTFYAHDKPEARPDALDYYLERAKEAAGPILEPMCGTGRYLLPLLASGLHVEGTDASPDMLALCRKEAQRMALSPILHEGRLQELALDKSFSLVIIPSGSFSLLILERDIVLCLTRIFAALSSGGRFIVEVERAGTIEPSMSGRWEGCWLTLPDGSELIHSWLQQYSGVEGVARSLHRYELISQGQLVRTEFENLAVRHHEPDSFRALLSTAGFTEVRCLSPYERTALDDRDEGMLFECRKV